MIGEFCIGELSISDGSLTAGQDVFPPIATVWIAALFDGPRVRVCYGSPQVQSVYCNPQLRAFSESDS